MIYRLLFRLVLQRLDSERAHSMAIAAMRAYAWIPGALRLIDRLLRPARTLTVRAFGLEFRTPLGLAAGVDKNSKAFDAFAALGFGAIEVGTATNLPQPGNERPRVWRLPTEGALLNALGFPNDGAAAQARRLARRRTKQVIGVNVGKSKEVDPNNDVVGDYRAATRKLAPDADYLALNVSSPNTPGLRSMQSVGKLRVVVDGVRAELAALGRQIPVLVKISPDLSNEEIVELAEAATWLEIDGIVAVNTTTDYENASVCRDAIAAHGDRGGISGQPLKQRALEVLELLSSRVEGLPLISVGGIETAEDAWQRILAGAVLVQAHTGFVYGGPLWPRRVNRGLARLLAASPYSTIEEAVGRGGEEKSHPTHHLATPARQQLTSRTTTAA